MTLAKVLIVEGDAVWLLRFHSLVGKATENTFEYMTVGTLAEGIEAIKGGCYGLVLLGLKLPDSEPENTIEAVAEYAKEIPIIIITTLDDEKTKQYAYKQGVEDYLIKENGNGKFDIVTFVHVCQQAMRRCSGRMTAAIEEAIAKVLDNLKEDYPISETS